jgi:hypothetical protein
MHQYHLAFKAQASAQAAEKAALAEPVTVFQDVIPFLAKIIGKESMHPIEWNYLNKGTHDEDKTEEFDSAVVKEMLILLKEIDKTI